MHSDWPVCKPVVLFSGIDELMQLVEHSDIVNIECV
jgi:hypothetical protein